MLPESRSSDLTLIWGAQGMGYRERLICDYCVYIDVHVVKKQALYLASPTYYFITIAGVKILDVNNRGRNAPIF